MKRLFPLLAALLLLASPPAQARTIKIYTFNGPSRKTTPAHVPDAYEMRLGSVVWASANVDDSGKFAVRPDMLTKFYQFNRGTAYSATEPITPSWDTTKIDEDNNWEAENNPCPTGWRLPTRLEFEALFLACNRGGINWADAGEKGNMVAGKFYGINHNAACSLAEGGSMDGCIFLPAVGSRDFNTGALSETGSNGRYWSSVQFNATSARTTYAYYWSFGKISNTPDANYIKTMGFPVRCVRDAP
jgi:uncharacterized protein (TIGR02145 family)